MPSTVWPRSPSSYEAPDRDGETLAIDSAYVDAHLGELVQDPDLSRYIL
jgi:ATP-dependent HslUV protease ATP-binding subunit HslU